MESPRHPVAGVDYLGRCRSLTHGLAAKRRAVNISALFAGRMELSAPTARQRANRRTCRAACCAVAPAASQSQKRTFLIHQYAPRFKSRSGRSSSGRRPSADARTRLSARAQSVYIGVSVARYDIDISRFNVYC